VLTTAFAPGGGAASAFTNATVGGSIASVNLTPGRVVSNAILIPGDFGAGAMSAALNGQPQQYEATAVFDFLTSSETPLYLHLPSDNLVGTGFGITLEVFANATNSAPTFSETFSSLTELGRVESFFASNPLLLGKGSQSIKLEYLLNYSSGTPYSPGYGFDFTYDFASSSAVAATPIATGFDFPLSQSSTVPEPSTWAMMLVGFAGLAFAGYRARMGLAGVENGRDRRNGEAAIGTASGMRSRGERSRFCAPS
jgi:hypothetical protein